MIIAIAKNSKKFISKNFNSNELDCHCTSKDCTFTLYSTEIVEFLDKMRAINGDRPIFITCGYRCISHNKVVGGVGKSQHLVGLACDIKRPAYLSWDEFVRLVYKVPNGPKFIKLYKDEDFIHVDFRTGGF